MTPSLRSRPLKVAARLTLGLACLLSLGCAAITNPVANGVPVRLLAEELQGPTKDGMETLPLGLLRQQPPTDYRLAPGDVLGVHIDGVLGEKGSLPPVNYPDAANSSPAVGLPIPIRANGTIPLPLVSPVRVEGMTIEEAEKAIVKAYTVTKRLLQPAQARILVTLSRPRQTRVLVIRQDSPDRGVQVQSSVRGFGQTTGVVGGAKQGTGTTVELPAYENDVLHALAKTGGLPGSDAANEIIIYRGGHCLVGVDAPTSPEVGSLHRKVLSGELVDGETTIRIPLRLCPGESIPFGPDDVILHDGDIVFIEAREAEVFYSAGLLPPGEHALPRDYDLRVVQAISQIGGPLVNGGINGNNISGSIVAPGLGSPSPSLLTVLRRTPSHGQVAIRVDLNRALRDPRENIRILPGDTLVLQETTGEATARYAGQVLNLSVFVELFRTSKSVGTGAASIP
ncbi:MAG: polysaccharide biosynthesis/export family protein [Planctomycetales bacterium]|nr:polysaccharide biosynthesis/export family protein [Planctomycetales bacterium]